jgi:hypothetical protein
MNWWVSWWHTDAMSDFELHSPYWISGEGDDGALSICAAIRTDINNRITAEEVIYECYDKDPVQIKFRFIEPKLEDWVPFNDRFQKAEWMKWP